MAKQQHVSKTAHDVSSASAGKLLQTRPFQNEHETENQQPSQVNAQSQSVTGGWDLTPKILSATNPSASSPTPVVGLPLQAKLTIGEPNDKYEQEADRVAHDVVQRINAPNTASSKDAEDETSTTNSAQQVQRQIAPPAMTGGFDLTSKWLSHPSPPPSAFGQPLQAKLTPRESPIQRETQEEDDELQMKPLLQRKSVSSGDASNELESSINRARSGGQSLDAGLQQSMGQAMGADFSNVKVHTDSTADSLNQSIQAKAFTTGQDVFFRQGAYQPGNRGGQELIAHELTHVVQQSNHSIKRFPQPESSLQSLESFGGSVIQRQTGELIQATLRLKKGTRVEILKDIGDRFQVKVIETSQKCWISGRLKDYFKEDLSIEITEDTVIETPTKTPVKETQTEDLVGTVTTLGKEPKSEDVIVDSVPESQTQSIPEDTESETSDVLPPPKSGDQVTMKVAPKPTLAQPVAGQKVFQSGGGDTLKVKVTRKEGTEKIDLKAGQNYLNDELSALYYSSESEIKAGKVTYGMLFGGSAVLGDGHHRFLWLAHHGKPIQAQVKRSAGGQAWSGMTYQPDPKKPKKAYSQDSTTPTLDIESANLDSNEVAKKLRSKWEGIDWGELKKPGLVFSTKSGELTTTAQYNPENHTIKLNKDETDPVNLWDNVLFEAQNALNAKVFDELGGEKGGKSETTFKEYGQKMATAEYDSVKRYVTALRELISNGLNRNSLTTLAKNNLAKWDSWDEQSLEESSRIKLFNNAPHDANATDTKAALSSAELYAYEAVESSLLKNINGKMSLILKNIFHPSASNGYYMKDQFTSLKTVVNKGPAPWPESGAARVIKYSTWLEEVEKAAKSIKDVVSMSGAGVNGKTLETFKEQFVTLIDSAKLSEKSVDIAGKLI